MALILKSGTSYIAIEARYLFYLLNNFIIIEYTYYNTIGITFFANQTTPMHLICGLISL